MTLQVAMRLQNLRKQKGLSQEELAEKIGVSRQAVSKWERAEASPDTDNLITLAKLYGISLDELVGENAEADEPAPEAEKTEKTEENFTDGNTDEYHQDPEANAKDEEKVHIGFDGIHVDSDGDHVHIDRNGVHVDSAKGEHVHIGADGVHVNEAQVIIQRNRSANRITGIVGGVTVFGSVILYILMGSFWQLWHPGWIIFFAIPVLPSLSDAIVKRNPNHFAYPVFITAVFLFLGCFYGWWHPGWVMFLTIPLYYMIADAFKRCRRANRITDIVGTVAVIGSVILYIFMGAFWQLWHPGWIIFFAIPVLFSLSDAIIKRNPNHFAYPVLITAIYLILGFVYGWWHPGWVVFLTIPIYYIITDAIRR